MLKRTLILFFIFSLAIFLCCNTINAATMTLRPDGTACGDTAYFSHNTTSFDDAVDDPVGAPDDATTVLYQDSLYAYSRVIYWNLSDCLGWSSNLVFCGITSVYFLIRGRATAPTDNVRGRLITSTGTNYTNVISSATWENAAKTLYTNGNGDSFSWTELAGATLGAYTFNTVTCGGSGFPDDPEVTQLYAIITYDAGNDDEEQRFSNVQWGIFSNKYEFTWDNGIAADYVMVRKEVEEYPDSTSDGSLVANVTGDTETITDWSQNEENYYSMWAWNTTYSVWSAPYNLSWGSFAFENISSEEYYQKCITFEGYISAGNAYVTYSDTLGRTNDTNISVYEINGSTGNITLFYYNYTVGGQSFQRDFAINTSNNYEVILNLNHTVFGHVYDYFFLIGSTRNITSPSRFDNIFDILGNNPFGWSGFVGFFVLIVGLFSFGARNAGVALVLTGGIMVFLTTIVGITLLAGVIAILLIVMGALVQIIAGGR